MFRVSFWVVIVLLGATSCGYQSSFQKQKYLKGNLKQTFGDNKAKGNEEINSDSQGSFDDKLEQEIDNSKIDLDEFVTQQDRVENFEELQIEDVLPEDLSRLLENHERINSRFLDEKKFFRSGPNDGEGTLGFLVLLFLILSVLSLILLIWLGPWAFLISFGCIVIAFLFYLWFNDIASTGGGLIGALGAILLFPLAVIILLLTMLIRWIVSLF